MASNSYRKFKHYNLNAVLGRLSWVGYALTTTTSSKLIEEIEKEIQKALEETEKLRNVSPNH